jgi:putative transposase
MTFHSALEEALSTSGTTPEIFNTNQGSQFTNHNWLNWLEKLKALIKIAISMDGKGRWIDNVIVERFWRSIKYEDIYIKLYEDVLPLKNGVENISGAGQKIDPG